MRKCFAGFAIISVCFVGSMVFFVRPAFAYLDPSSGSVMLQLSICFFLGALFILKTSLGWIARYVKNLLMKNKRKPGL